MRGKAIMFGALVFSLTIPVLSRAQVSPNSRLYQRPEWDGAVVTGPWLRAEMRYQHWNFSHLRDTNAFSIGPTFALPISDTRAELGGRFWLISCDPDGADNATSLSDIDLWGKYQLIDDPFLLSIGVLTTLPTGNDKVTVPRATGEFNLEFFTGLRVYLTDLFAFIGHAGFRFNSDADIKYSDESRFTVDGKASAGFGGGILFQAAPQLDIMMELNYESERYRHSHSDTELTGMLEYNVVENLSLSGGLGIGLDKMAPALELIFGLTTQF